jgi:hypothetical protein
MKDPNDFMLDDSVGGKTFDAVVSERDQLAADLAIAKTELAAWKTIADDLNAGCVINEDRIRALEAQDEVHWKTRRSLLADNADVAKINVDLIQRNRALEAALREARKWIGDGEHSDGLARGHWTPEYAAVVDLVNRTLPQSETDEPVGNHPSHGIRFSDASTFDAICDKCGCTDATPEGTYALSVQCLGKETATEAHARLQLGQGIRSGSAKETPAQFCMGCSSKWPVHEGGDGLKYHDGPSGYRHVCSALETSSKPPIEMTGWCAECGCGKNEPDGRVIFAHMPKCSKANRGDIK